MSVRMLVVLGTAAAAVHLSSAGPARAGQPYVDASAPPAALSLDVAPPGAPQYPQDTGPAEHRPLMALLDRVGMARPLDDGGINIFGHIEAGYSYFDPTSKVPNFNEFAPDRIFDFEHEDPTLNQVDLTFERIVDLRSPRFDAGFRIEWLYGSDARFIHANGLNFY